MHLRRIYKKNNRCFHALWNDPEGSKRSDVVQKRRESCLRNVLGQTQGEGVEFTSGGTGFSQKHSLPMGTRGEAENVGADPGGWAGGDGLTREVIF